MSSSSPLGDHFSTPFAIQRKVADKSHESANTVAVGKWSAGSPSAFCDLKAADREKMGNKIKSLHFEIQDRGNEANGRS